MKSRIIKLIVARRCLVVLVGSLVFAMEKGSAAPFSTAPDFTNDGRPDVAWRDGYIGDNYIWQMQCANCVPPNGGTPSVINHHLPFTYPNGSPVVNPDPNWRMVGSGNFNAGTDNQRDILWRYEGPGPISGALYVWFMNGTVWPGTPQSVANIMQPEDSNWKLAGTGDFNRDGHTDLIWQHAITWVKAIWYMQGTLFSSALYIDADWPAAGYLLVGVGQLSHDANGNLDDNPDLIMQHVGTSSTPAEGYTLVWPLNSAAQRSYGVHLMHPAPSTALWQGLDLDERIVGTGDYNGDGKTDLLIRHTTWGKLGFWFLDSFPYSYVFSLPEARVKSAAWYFPPVPTPFVPQPERDPLKKVMSQDLKSTWRITSGFPQLTAYASGSTLYVTYSRGPTPVGEIKIERKLASASDSTFALIAGTSSGGPSLTVQDATAAPNTLYEYRGYQANTSGTPITEKTRIFAGLNLAPPSSRGKVILVVDKEVASGLTSDIAILTDDLIKDGFTVLRYTRPVVGGDALRHDDSNFANNIVEIGNIQSFIKNNRSTTGPTFAYIIGHVVVPYSGKEAVDGHVEFSDCTKSPCHYCPAPPNPCPVPCKPCRLWCLAPDHQGAWACDMFYADDENLLWTEGTVDHVNCDLPVNTNRNGVNADGKFGNDSAPSSLETAVGRVDFANLPGLSAPLATPPNQNEITYLQRYLQKIHNYRVRSSAPLRNQAIVFTGLYGVDPTTGKINVGRGDPMLTLNGGMATNAVQTSGVLFGSSADKLLVGDPFKQLDDSRSFLWAFACGNGAAQGIYVESTDPNTAYQDAFFSDSLSNPAKVPRIGHYVLLGSYFGDFNIQNDLMRSLLTPANNYGFSAVWTRNVTWRFDGMAVGQPLGLAMLNTINNPEIPPSLPERKGRETAIMGDPTLRLSYVAPPGTVTVTSQGANSAKVEWLASPDSGSNYYVYRGNSATGPWTLVNSTSALQLVDNAAALAGQRHYLVKASLVSYTGAGSYVNASVGRYGAN